MYPNPYTKARAEAALERACDELGLEDISLEWVPAEGCPPGAFGFVRVFSAPKTIFLNTNQGPDPLEVVDTVAHECFHLYDHEHGIYRPKAAWGEARAVAWAQRFTVKHAAEIERQAEASMKRLSPLLDHTVKLAADFLETLEAAGLRSVGKGCGCGSAKNAAPVEDDDRWIQRQLRRAAKAGPVRRQLMSIEDLARWTKAVDDEEEEPDGFLARTLADREAYERRVCSDPRHAAQAPFCHTRP